MSTHYYEAATVTGTLPWPISHNGAKRSTIRCRSTSKGCKTSCLQILAGGSFDPDLIPRPEPPSNKKCHRKLTVPIHSFKSQRYLGKTHDVVRQTRQITVLPRAEDHIIVRQRHWTSRWPRVLSAKVYGLCCILVMLFASVGFSFSTMQLGFVFGLKR